MADEPLPTRVVWPVPWGDLPVTVPIPDRVIIPCRGCIWLSARLACTHEKAFSLVPNWVDGGYTTHHAPIEEMRSGSQPQTCGPDAVLREEAK